MEAPIIPVENVVLKPGFKKKYVLLVDLTQPQYAEFAQKIKVDLISFINETGGVYENLDEGEYEVELTPLKIEVKVK